MSRHEDHPAPDEAVAEEPVRSEEPRAAIRAPRPRVVGPNQTMLAIAALALAVVLALAIFLTPRPAPQPAARPAPQLPESTYLDRPLPPVPDQQQEAAKRPWWESLLEEQPPEDDGVPAPWLEEDPWLSQPQPTSEPTPRNPRQEGYERAVRSAAVHSIEGSPGRDTAPGAGLTTPADRLLDSAASLLSATPGGTTPPAPRSTAAQQVATVQAGGASDPGLAPPVPAGWPALRAGTLIPASLETAIHSDAPGPVVARVVRAVHDSRTGVVVVPAGARLLGRVASQLAVGQERVLVVFEELVLPGGLRRALPAMPALQGTGAGGLPGRVDRHWGQTLGQAALLALVGAGFQLSQPDRGDRVGLAPEEVVSSQLGLELSRVASQTLSRGLARPPTVQVGPGTRFLVYVAHDLAL